MVSQLIKNGNRKNFTKVEKNHRADTFKLANKIYDNPLGFLQFDNKKIWLNVQLAKKTPECLEYVILHELIHLEEKNHNDRFIALMDKHMPMWREIKDSLNSQPLDYMK